MTAVRLLAALALANLVFLAGDVLYNLAAWVIHR